MSNDERTLGGRIVDAVTHPVSLVSALVAMLTNAFSPVFGLFDLVAATAQFWFPAVGAFSTLATKVPAIPAALGNGAFAVAAAAYLLLKVDALIDYLQNNNS